MTIWQLIILADLALAFALAVGSSLIEMWGA